MMTAKPYTVKRGDCLWSIASQQLGDPRRWPEIYDYNNTPNILLLAKTRITDPNLIFVGQTIYIPNNNVSKARTRSTFNTQMSGSSRPRSSARARNNSTAQIPSANRPPSLKGGVKTAFHEVRSIPFQYNLHDLGEIKLYAPTHIAIIRLTGSITLLAKNNLQFASLATNGQQIVTSIKAESQNAFMTIAKETKIGFNPLTKQVTFENSITIGSNYKYSPTFSLSTSVSSTGAPCIKASSQCPPLQGHIGGHLFQSTKMGIEIEIIPTIKPPSGKELPKAIPVPIPVPNTAPSAQRLPNQHPQPIPADGWVKLAGTGLIIAAGAVIVATIIEDFATLGVGIADDVPSFAAASVMFSAGWLSLSGNQSDGSKGNPNSI